jgi:ABC-type multidrug transport system fused ATPase/permease subunit
MNMSVRFATELESTMNSVERVQHYTKTTEQEGQDVPIPTAKLEDAWPARGQIQFEHYSLKYKTGDPVLLNLTADIPAGTKVGIVGRTGAGKSSLLLGLFRLIEAQEGSISVDGVDISTVQLDRLRSSMAMIPQVRLTRHDLPLPLRVFLRAPHFTSFKNNPGPDTFRRHC